MDYEQMLMEALSPLVNDLVALEGKVKNLSLRKGDPGNGIKSIMQVGDHHVVVVMEDQQQIALKLPSAKDGVGVSDMRPGEKGELSITLTDGKKFAFVLPKGDAGLRGKDGASIKGDRGDKGDRGPQGRGIKSIETDGSDEVRFVFEDDEEVPVRLPRGQRGASGVGIKSVESDGAGSMTLNFSDGSSETILLPRGEKGDRGLNGDRGVQGDTGKDGIGIESLTGVDDEVEIKLDNGQLVKFRLPRGPRGQDAPPPDVEDVAKLLAVNHSNELRGKRGDKGDPGVGMEAKTWKAGVYRSGEIVQANIGQFFLAKTDTSEIPGVSDDWERIGKGGFRWCKVKKAGVEYEDGDLFIDEGTTFLFFDGRAHMWAKRGDKGGRGDKGDKGEVGEAGAHPVAVRLKADSLILAMSNGELLEAPTNELTEYVKAVADESVATHVTEDLYEKVMSWIDQGFSDSESGNRLPINSFRGTHQPGMDVKRGDVVGFNNKMWLAKRNNKAVDVNADDYEPLPGGGSRVSSTSTSGGGGHVIEDEGTTLTQRANLNFAGAGVSVADAGGKTVVTIPAGGPTGATGATGPAGPTGPTGPAGADGAPGSGVEITFAGDSITQAAGTPLTTWTQNGIQWTNSYTAGVLVSRKAFIGQSYELAVNIIDTPPYFVDTAADNIFVDGGAIRCTLAQAQALEAAAIAGTITLQKGLRLSVIDCASMVSAAAVTVTSPAIWMWNGLWFDYDFEMGSMQVLTDSTVSGTTDLTSVVVPRAFMNAPWKVLKPNWFAEADIVSTPSGNTTFRILLNNSTSPYFYSAGGAASATDRRIWDGSKRLHYRGAALQVAQLAGSLEGYQSIPSDFSIDSATTDFTFKSRITQGVTPMPFTQRRFSVRCMTRAS